jgi:hypothetical protein
MGAPSTLPRIRVLACRGEPDAIVERGAMSAWFESQ